MTDLLQTIIDKGNNVFPVKISGEWVEVDTVIDLKLDITKKTPIGYRQLKYVLQKRLFCKRFKV